MIIKHLLSLLLYRQEAKLRLRLFKHYFSILIKKLVKINILKAGSELPIDNSIFDKDTIELRYGTNVKPYSAYHLNVCYDLLEYTYNDIIIQDEAKKNENDVF